MKAHLKNIILFVSISFLVQVNTLHLTNNNRVQNLLPSPPVAKDLANHFGFDPNANIYGPQATKSGDLMVREGLVRGKNIPITPITNLNKEINPSEVVSGSLLNTSYDAGKIIKANIAGKYIIIY